MNDREVSMIASVILAHPYEGSFNHALFRTTVDTFSRLGVKVFAHDLYVEGFDPVLTRAELGKAPTSDALVKRYSDELIESDILVFIHPNWWGQPPAILKGYIDRVIRPPHAYDFPADDSGGGLPIGKLEGKVGIVLNTSNTDGEREDDYFHDPLEWIWRRCVFGFCGIEDVHRRVFRIVADSTAEERAGWLAEVEVLLESARKRVGDASGE